MLERWSLPVALASLAVASMPLGCASTGQDADAGPMAASPGQTGDAAAEAAAEAERNFLRNPAPRAQETIFSPLPLPDPNSVRLASGAPGPDYWQQRVDYDIDATLDHETRRLTARAVVTYTNNSPEDLDYLWLHLEQNLFRPDSTATLSSEPGARFTARDNAGGYDIGAVRLADGRALELSVYDVLGRLDLPEPVAAEGGQVTFEIEWSFKIPAYGIDRFGIEEVEQGTIYQLAQWFPQVAAYDDYYGWNTLPYLGTGEFYTNFGDYRVSLTVPREFIVACTGELQNPEEVLTETQRQRLDQVRQGDEIVMIVAPEEVGDPSIRPEGDGPLTWEFVAENVRDVAWTASDAFIWDAAFLADSGPIGPNGERTGTLVQSLYPKEGQEVWKQSTDMLRFAIDGYNRRWYTYPYPTATNVNGIVGGMEYPMMIFCRSRRHERGLWGVTTHEIGHNWFPMVVNTDERRHAWMDEGFNTFINHYSGLERYPDDNAEPADDEGAGKEMAGFMAQGNRTPVMMHADQLRNLGATQYWKPSYALQLLREQILGPERFDRAFREYIHNWAFKSPRPADFFRTMHNAAGADLWWFWRGMFYESAQLDQEVAGVEVSEGQIRVTFRNNDEMVMPVHYRVTYADGTVEERRLPVEAWFSTNEWTTGWDAQGREVVEVWIDPKHHFPDYNRDNNKWAAPTAEETPEQAEDADSEGDDLAAGAVSGERPAADARRERTLRPVSPARGR